MNQQCLTVQDSLLNLRLLYREGVGREEESLALRVKQELTLLLARPRHRLGALQEYQETRTTEHMRNKFETPNLTGTLSRLTCEKYTEEDLRDNLTITI